MDYRHEVKHVITAGDAAAIRTNLSAVARLDPHAKEKGYYRIRSLYFDDPMDTALHEKLDDVNERRKFRILKSRGRLLRGLAFERPFIQFQYSFTHNISAEVDEG